MASKFNKDDINNIKNWKRTSKKLYEVYVCRPVLGTAVTNKLEGASYTTDKNKQFVISGTLGEQQVIDVGKLAQTYTFLDGTPITPDGLKAKKVGKSGEIDWMHLKTKQQNKVTNWAFHLPASVKDFPVQTSRGDTVLANRVGVAHGLGDFLVCSDLNGQPNLNDIWVVNGIIFPTTYDMRAFPGIMNEISKRMKGKNLSETVVPKSIIGKKPATTTTPSEAAKAKAGTTSEATKTGATRGAKRTEYQLTGRYMTGGVVVGYNLQSINSDKSGRYTRDQLCYLLGRGQITNCTGSVSQGRVIIRGKGMSIDSLPTVEVEKGAKRSRSRAGAGKSDAVNSFSLVGKIKSGNSVVGYVISNTGLGQKKVSKAQFIDLIKAGRVTNATYQNYKGQELMRGVGISLKDLPVYSA